MINAESLSCLTNREKIILIEHLRQETGRPLGELTAFLRISKGSYEHQRKALARDDKYADTRRRIVEAFEEADRARDTATSRMS